MSFLTIMVSFERGPAPRSAASKASAPTTIRMGSTISAPSRKATSAAFRKIDYYDRATEAGSPDPADPAVTTRVLTLMRADEY